MFEPDGREALSCGNGLMCIADFLHRKYGMESIRIMTEIPSGRPMVISIRTDVESGKKWANMGHPRRMPPELVVPGAIKPHDDTIGMMEDIGTYVNKRYGDLFPAGLNINFVRKAPGTQALEYRCFKRGIYRETLACGTGALAASFVSRRLNLLGPNPITIWPHRCRWKIPDAHIIVKEQPGGWYLYGNPYLLFSGNFVRLSKPMQRETTAAQPLAAVHAWRTAGKTGLRMQRMSNEKIPIDRIESKEGMRCGN